MAIKGFILICKNCQSNAEVKATVTHYGASVDGILYCPSCGFSEKLLSKEITVSYAEYKLKSCTAY